MHIFKRVFKFRTESKPEDNLGLLIEIHHLSLNPRLKKPTIKQSGLIEDIGQRVQILEIDQTRWFHNGSLRNLREAFRVQRSVEKTIGKYLGENPQSHLRYFGLAHIPFIFHIGCTVNREEVNVFATDRQTGAWIALDRKIPNWPPLQVNGLPKTANDYVTDCNYPNEH